MQTNTFSIPLLLFKVQKQDRQTRQDKTKQLKTRLIIWAMVLLFSSLKIWNMKVWKILLLLLQNNILIVLPWYTHNGILYHSFEKCQSNFSLKKASFNLNWMKCQRSRYRCLVAPSCKIITVSRAWSTMLLEYSPALHVTGGVVLVLLGSPSYMLL